MYKTDGCKSVDTETALEAAEIIAGRIARRQYGRRGYCRVLRMESWSADHSHSEYSAFLGYKRNGETIGSNVRFTVRAI
jgi:hypothetical protein